MQELNELKAKEKAILAELESNRLEQKKAEEAEKHKDKPRTFEDACQMLKLDSKKEIPENLPDHVQAYMQLCIITKALNEGWVPDWSNSNEYKYYPWFDMSKGPSGVSYVDYTRWFSNAFAASRLCFKNAELARYAGTQFVEIFRRYIYQQ